MHRRVTLSLVSALVLAACGGTAEPPAPEPTSTARPALQTAPKRSGEIVVTGDASPASHGPYDFDGTYTVRFAQYAPEDPNFDFTGATSFAAALDREAEISAADSIALFEDAAATGSRRVRATGRFFVDVSFGDFPYVVRFTPRG